MKALRIYIGSISEQLVIEKDNYFTELDNRLSGSKLNAEIKSNRLFIYGFINRSYSLPSNESKIIDFIDRKINSFEIENKKEYNRYYSMMFNH